MAHFIVTFRIGSNSTYQARYDSFVSRIHELAGGTGKTWEETTSFAAFKATGTAETVCNDLYLKTDFAEADDLMIVIDLDAKVKATKGKVKYASTLTSALGF